MKSFHGFVKAKCAIAKSPSTARGRWGVGPVLPLVLVVIAGCLGLARSASGQVAATADAGGLIVSAGATASGYYIQYGEKKMLGVTGFVDVDTRRRMGFEAEARIIRFNETSDETVSTYMAGPRYHFNVGRLQPYVKGMVGIGQFNGVYGLASGSFLVVGGGVDYRFNRRITIRLADVGYQAWPQFDLGTGGMNTMGVSTGLRVRIF